MSSARLCDSSAGRIDRRKATRAPRAARARNLGALLFFAIAAVLAAGCGAARPAKYYQLELPSDPSPAKATDPLPITLLLGRLKGSHLYREDRIVYGGKGEEMGTYEYQRWSEPPTEMIQEMLLRGLRATGRYQGVYLLSSTTRGDYILHGQLFDFKEISGGSMQARVTLELELRDLKSGTTVWTHSYTHDEPVSGKEITAVVAALDRNVQRCVGQVSASLEEYFASHPPK